MDELKRRLSERGLKIEWDVVRQDLEALEHARVREGDQWYLLRSPLQGVAGNVLQAVGVGVPPPVRPIKTVVPNP